MPSSANCLAMRTNWRWLPTRYCGPPTTMTIATFLRGVAGAWHIANISSSSSRIVWANSVAFPIAYAPGRSSRKASTVRSINSGNVEIATVFQYCSPTTDS